MIFATGEQDAVRIGDEIGHALHMPYIFRCYRDITWFDCISLVEREVLRQRINTFDLVIIRWPDFFRAALGQLPNNEPRNFLFSDFDKLDDESKPLARNILDRFSLDFEHAQWKVLMAELEKSLSDRGIRFLWILTTDHPRPATELGRTCSITVPVEAQWPEIFAAAMDNLTTPT
jgi:hypothetical protein